MTEKKVIEDGNLPPQTQRTNVSRRKFLSYAGLSASALAIASCQKDLTGKEKNDLGLMSNKNPNDKPRNVVNLGHGDIGILNYAYALDIKVAQNFASGFDSKERTYLEDIRDHEIAHREFFRNVLGSRAIGTLEVNFSSINFADRASVLATAKAFEDLGVAAYNGAGQLLESADYLLFAGKIVSVEARHAAAIRDLISYGSFADSTVVNEMGLDVVLLPPQVLDIASTYIETRIIANNLPTS
jgi:hypothetical protein